MDTQQLESNNYSKNKSTEKTYVGKELRVKNADGSTSEKRYVTKVFDIEDFQEYYKDLKNKGILKVLREGERQEVVAIVDKEERSFSLRIQRFTKETGMPHSQSFSFHSGALIKLIEFIDSLGFIDFSNKSYFSLHDTEIKKQKQFWLNNTEVLQYIERFDSSLLKKIFEKIQDEKKLKIILDSLSSVEIEHLEASIKQAAYKTALEDLKSMISFEQDKTKSIVEEVKKDERLNKYSAGQPEKIFQNWIEANLWIFGIEYYKKHNWRIIDSTPNENSEADLVMETMDGYVDLIELKRPRTKSDKILSYDIDHKSFFPARDLSLALGQCLHYLKKLDEQKVTIEKKNSTKVLRPRVKLIIGRSADFDSDEYDALRMINSNLSHVQIITYDDLVKNGELILSYYRK